MTPNDVVKWQKPRKSYALIFVIGSSCALLALATIAVGLIRNR